MKKELEKIVTKLESDTRQLMKVRIHLLYTLYPVQDTKYKGGEFSQPQKK